MKPRLAAFTLAVLAGSCPVAAAPAAQDLLETLGHCAGIADDHARLACYDSLAPRVKDALAKPPDTLDHPPTAEEQRSWFGFDVGNLFGSAPSQQSTPEQFGSDKLPASRAPESAAASLDSISAGVTEVAYTPFGRFIVFLNNGQVWRQIEADTDKATFRKPANANTITISRGFVGSYNLTINDSARTYKVTRLK